MIRGVILACDHNCEDIQKRQNNDSVKNYFACIKDIYKLSI